MRDWILWFRALAILLATVAPAFAGEGRIPIWEPTAITAAGKYIVTRNINGPPGVPVIDILASGVDIELNGQTLVGSGAPVIRAVGHDTITIRNGSVFGDVACIQVVSAPGGSSGVSIS